MFAGWENKRTTLRRRRQEQELTFTYTDEILTKTCPLKLLIEITTGTVKHQFHCAFGIINSSFQFIDLFLHQKFILAGDVKVYVEHTLKPIIEFKDKNPLQIKYFGFSSLGQSLARYFYDCRGEEVYTKSQLNAQCQRVNVSSAMHTKFHSIPSNPMADTDRYSIEIPMHVDASHDAKFVVASDNSFNSIRNGYEIGMYIVYHLHIGICLSRSMNFQSNPYVWF